MRSRSLRRTLSAKIIPTIHCVPDLDLVTVAAVATKLAVGHQVGSTVNFLLDASIKRIQDDLNKPDCAKDFKKRRGCVEEGGHCRIQQSRGVEVHNRAGWLNYCGQGVSWGR